MKYKNILFVKLNSYINRSIGIATVLVALILIPFSVSASYFDKNDICIDYTLPNGVKYSLKPSVVTTSDKSAETEITYEEYVFVLPYSVKDSKVDVYPQPLYKGETEVGKDGVVLEQGIYTMYLEEKEYIINVLYASDIPQIYITLGEEELKKVYEDKTYRSCGKILIVDGDTVEYNNELEYLSGRGNASWQSSQKPYNIKLKAKSKIFEMAPSKKFCLISTASESLGIRNKIAFDFAENVGIEYMPETEMIDLYINGIYRGNYCFSERIEVSEERINIFDLEELNQQFNPGVDFEQCATGGDIKEKMWARAGSYKWTEIPNEATDNLDGGFLLELETGYRIDNVKSSFVTIHGQPVAIKSPEYASQKQVEYIRNYFQEFEYSILNDTGYSNEGKHMSWYADMQSFAKMFAYQDYLINLDAGITSFYMHKDLNGKFVAGPAWDMDISIASTSNRFGKDMDDPECIWAGDIWRVDATEWRNFLTMLWTHEEFRNMVAWQWRENFSPETENFLNNTRTVYEETKNSLIASRYIYINSKNKNVEQINYQLEKELDKVLLFIEQRSDFMDEYLSEERHSLIYANNGGYGVTIDPNTYNSNETVEVLKEEYILSGAEFIGWNTERDGSGEWYYPGDTVVIGEQSMVLYAQWSNGYCLPEYNEAVVESTSLLQMLLNKIRNLF